MVTPGPMVEIANLRVRYGRREVLKGISLEVQRNEVLGIIGPAQSGKTTLLRILNRTLDDVPGVVITGTVKVDGVDVRQVKDVFALRRKIGMVAPLPVGLPLSIFDNVAFAPRMAGIRDRSELEERVERCLRQATLWDEVKDRLHSLGTRLSGGQQQRLTIARALSHDPEDSLPRRVLHRHRPRDHHAHRGRAEELARPDDHHPGHQSGSAGAATR